MEPLIPSITWLDGRPVSRARQAELLGGEGAREPQRDAVSAVRRLRVLKARGASLFGLVSALLAEVAQRPDAAFREAFYAQLGPELNALAASLAREPDEARRAILESFGQLSAQIRPEQAGDFRKLLAAAATRDVEALLGAMRQASGPAAVAALETTLRRTNVAALRDVFVEAALPELARQARLLSGIPQPGQAEVLRAFARLGELTTSFGTRQLATCLRQSWAAPRAAGWAARAVQAATAKACGLRLLVALAVEPHAAGERGDASELAAALAGALAAVRGHLQQSATAVMALAARPQAPKLAPARARAFEDLHHAGELAVAALAGSAAAWAEHKAAVGRGRAHVRLAEQALLLLGTADLLGTTSAGQQLFAYLGMRAAAGEETALRALPAVAAELGEPARRLLLHEAGFGDRAFADGGAGYLRRTGEAVARSLAPLVAEQLRARRWKEATTTCRALLAELGPLLGVTLAARGPLEQALSEVMGAAGTERARSALAQLDALLPRPDEAMPVRVLAAEVVRALSPEPVSARVEVVRPDPSAPPRPAERRGPFQAALVPARVIAG